MNSGRRDERQHEGGSAENAPAGAGQDAANRCETDRHGADRCGASRHADRHGDKPHGTQRSDDAGATPGQCRDDRGTPVQLGEIRRVVSLVPSLTEAIVATCPQLLVGCTDFCVRPPDMDDVVGHAVRRVRGTKNPDRAAIAELRPDLVIANDEENRAFDVEKLRADGVPVWVTHIPTVPDALTSMARLFDVLGCAEEPSWLTVARQEWQPPFEGPRLTAVVPIWRDPWMCIGPNTYAADVLAHCGVDLAPLPDDGTRYPHVELETILELGVDRVILPDEPYSFGRSDAADLPGCDVRFVDGQRLVWYGPMMVGARSQLTSTMR